MIMGAPFDSEEFGLLVPCSIIELTNELLPDETAVGGVVPASALLVKVENHTSHTGTPAG